MIDGVDISVVIPLAPDEQKPMKLMNSLPQNVEVILSQKNGRANSLNHGAAQATGKYLWFLHADSTLPADAWQKLTQAISDKPQALHYCDLAFFGDSFWMKINAWGANVRSRRLGCPFGDQGLCISSALFDQLAGFPEELAYGEDHVFVWKARQHMIPLNPINTTLITSARKYHKQGWLKTTLLHQYLFLKQAWPQWRLMRKIHNKDQS